MIDFYTENTHKNKYMPKKKHFDVFTIFLRYKGEHALKKLMSNNHKQMHVSYAR